MPNQAELIKIDAIRRAEQVYRSDLVNDPADTSTRIKLAWCLFVEAIHAAGRESVLRDLSECERKSHEDLETAVRAIQDSAVDHLLSDCLRQTTAVMHLSREDRERTDMELLQMLINLAGAEHSTAGTAEEARRCLNDITRAIVGESEETFRPRSGLRRIPVYRSK